MTEDVTISGHVYRFFTKLPYGKMLEFNYDLYKVAKREIYKSMLDSGEIEDPIGSAMVSTKMAEAWVYSMGFECPAIIQFLCARIALPIEEKSPSLLESVYESGEDGINQLKHFFIELKTLTQKTNETLSPSPESLATVGPEKTQS